MRLQRISAAYPNARYKATNATTPKGIGIKKKREYVSCHLS
jgi:hypothetical protein